MQNFAKIRPLVLLLMLLGCQAKGFSHTSANSAPQSLAELKANMAFTCQHEHKPALSPETQQLYLYAHYQDLHNMWRGKKGDAVWQSTLPYYRIAAANGDYKANLRLQWLLETGRIQVKKPQTEVYSLNKTLEKTLPATAMYKLYYHLDSNYGVSTAKSEGKFAYLRKAADMGSRDAQFMVAEILERIDHKATLSFRISLAEQFLRCAAQQGMGEAAESLGLGFTIDKKYQDALYAYHLGVKAGNQQSAFRLSNGFKITDPKITGYLGGNIDLERSKRYEMIDDYLFKYDFLKPSVPDLDEIVPLPPAKLPRWDGKIAFQRWYEGPSPAKPSDELMQKLAAKANLDWQTGLPLKK